MLSDTSSISVRPVTVTDTARPVSPSRPETAAAELPPERRVTPAAQPAAASNDKDPRADALSRKVLIDRATSEVVYRFVDPRTDYVVRQIPEQAMLRLRAYNRAVTATSAETAEANPAADRRV